jgi:hypothetical protein
MNPLGCTSMPRPVRRNLFRFGRKANPLRQPGRSAPHPNSQNFEKNTGSVFTLTRLFQYSSVAATVQYSPRKATDPPRAAPAWARRSHGLRVRPTWHRGRCASQTGCRERYPTRLPCYASELLDRYLTVLILIKISHDSLDVGGVEL